MISREKEYFIEMIEKYYQTQTDFDIQNDKDCVNILADFAENCASFVNYLLNRDEEEYYIVTEKGREFLKDLNELQELEEKLIDRTILFTEYQRLEVLKAKLGY